MLYKSIQHLIELLYDFDLCCNVLENTARLCKKYCKTAAKRGTIYLNGVIAMCSEYNLKVIARIHNDFLGKFGVPRQSGLADDIISEIVFEKQYRDANALRGIEGFSHLWLIWYFSEVDAKSWSPTVRPPRLGGNKRTGVFATRSPYRPNPVGLSSVKLESVEKTIDRGVILKVSGADLMNGTPILDIKPYLPFSDCHTDAAGGFAEAVFGKKLDVIIPDSLKNKIATDSIKGISDILAEDPRPSYQNDSERIYTFEYGSCRISFRVESGTLYVTEITDFSR